MDEPKKRNRKRGSGEGSVYPVARTRMRNGRAVEVVLWEGYVTLPGLTAAGKQRRKYVTKPTKQECQAEVRKLLNSRDAGTLTDTKSPTFEEWTRYYLTELAPKKRVKNRSGNAQRTIESYASLMRNWAYPRIGKIRLDRLTVDNIEVVYAAMAEAGMATSSIQQCHAAIRVSLEMAWSRERIARNPARQAIVPLGAAPKEDRSVELEEMQRILEVAKRRQHGAKWVVRTVYGLRQGEALGLCTEQVDFTGEGIRIDRQLQRRRAEHGCGDPLGAETIPGTYTHGCGPARGERTVSGTGQRLRHPRPDWPCGYVQPARCPLRVEEATGKTRTLWPCGKLQPAACPDGPGGGLHLVRTKSEASTATLPMPAQIAGFLRARVVAGKRERIQSGSDWVGWTFEGRAVHFLFGQANGRPVDARDDYDEWVSILAEAGCEHIRPHATRSWAATMLVALGVHPRVAMDVLRHADVRTTLNLYAKSPDPDLRKAAAEQAALFLGPAETG